MAKSNRILTIELRLLNVEDDVHEACKELTTNMAKELHANATLLVGSGARPKVYHYGESYNIDVSKLSVEKDVP